jgi:translocation and assembly module TamB
LLLNRTTIAFSVILLAGIVGGAWWSWVFVNSRLAPLVEENVQKILGRPVQLGKVESVGFTNLKFGATSVPATNTDVDNLTAEAVVVDFDPLRLIFQRTLQLNVALVKPQVYIAQDKDGRWVTTKINTDLPSDGRNFLTTKLNSLRLENGNAVLLPYSQPSKPRNSIGFTELNGVANLLDNNQKINFNINTKPTNGGTLAISGDSHFKSQQTNLKIDTSNFLAADVSNLIESPVNIQAGRIDANLNLGFKPNQKLPEITGNANINQVTAKISNLPQAFIGTTGKLQFQGQNIGQNISVDNLTTRFGTVPVQVKGTINTQTGYNLNAFVQPVAVKSLLNTFNVKTPIPVAGELQANLQIKGTPQQPNIIGKVSTTKATQIDRVIFQNISSSFTVTPKEVILQQIQATPNIGGNIDGTISGSGRVGLGNQGQVALNIKADQLSGDALAQIYNFSSNNIKIGNLSANAQVSGTLNNVRSQIFVQAPAATYPGRLEVVIPKPGVLQLENAVFNVGSGKVTGSGQLLNNRFNAQVNTSGIQLSQFVQLPPKFQGLLNGKFNLSGNTASVKANTIQAIGQADVNLAQGGTINLNNIRLNNGRWQTAANISQIALNRVAENLPKNLQGQLVNANLQLSGNTDSFDLATIAATGRANLNLAQGTVNLRNIRLGNGRWQTAANVSQIALNRVAENLPKNLQGQLVNANLQLSGNTKSFGIETIQAAGQARLSLAQGTVNLRNIRLGNGRWQTATNVSQIALNRVAENLPKNLQGQLVNANLQLSGNTKSFELATIQAAGQARLNLAQGAVNLRNIRLDKGNWQALANIYQIQLNRLSNTLRGRLNGNVLATGNIASFEPNDIRLAGKVNFSQGLAQLQQPLNAQFQWTGEQLQIQQATAPGLSASGTVGLLVKGTAQVTALNLNVFAQGYNLQNLPFALPGNVALLGSANFAGQVTGTLDAIKATGDIGLRNFRVNGLAFDPSLTGKVNFQSGQEAQLQLNGKQDVIAVNIGADNRPNSFLIRRDSSVATGRREGDNLLVNVRDFPIGVLQSFLPKNVNNFGRVAGDLSADLTVNLNNFGTSGDVTIDKPQIGRAVANQFRGRIGFDNGNFSLTQGELRQGENLYLLSGSLPSAPNRPLEFKVSFNQANIQSFLQGFSIFALEDLSSGLQTPTFGNASDLATQPVSLQKTDFLAQLRQYSEIVKQVEQQRTQENKKGRIPTLAELQGKLDGAVTVAGTLQSGLNLGFNFQGSNLAWGDYNINKFVANGNFADGLLTLLPVSVNLDKGRLAFRGQFSLDELSGQAEVIEFPLDLVKAFTPNLPMNVTGNLNALITLAGSLKNPAAKGEISLSNGTLNNQPVQSAQLSFGYSDARLNFGSNVLVTGTQPLQITGKIPFGLPFASVQPDSNQIDIQANVQNEGLSILNVLNNQVSWVDGQGQVNVAVTGTLSQPTINGVASVKNATFKAQVLNEPLTNVTGNLKFTGDSIFVEGVQGEYREGQLTASGILPIVASQNAQSSSENNPLTVSLNNLRANLQELYQGGVSGNAVIRGTAFNPQLGGEIRLSDGEISLRQQANTGNLARRTTSTSFNTTLLNRTTPIPNEDTSPTSISANNQQTTSPVPIEFTNLKLILDNNVRVTQQPIASFIARGDITLNGTLAKPRPDGTIDVERGQINLFSTQFALARGYKHTATFTPSQGFDPFLDVRLVAIVPEARRTRILESPLSGEIEDVSANNFGTLNTVRVQAIANGPASKLADNLQLTSQPNRSRAEIVALLGGSVVDFLDQPDAALGVVSLAGSAVFGGLQGTFNEIGQLVGLSELRVSPTVVTNSRTNSSVLGLSAEAVFDISNNFSASLSRVFATDEPFRYNLLYRLNDEIILRGSTNLSDESRATVEFERRF